MIGLFAVFVPIALLIKLDSPGPIFFIQERVGKSGKPFGLFKFRTMVEKNSRGIKKGSKRTVRRTHQTDTPWITFDQFFEVMSASMTRGDKDGSDGSNMLKEDKVKGSGI